MKRKERASREYVQGRRNGAKLIANNNNDNNFACLASLVGSKATAEKLLSAAKAAVEAVSACYYHTYCVYIYIYPPENMHTSCVSRTLMPALAWPSCFAFLS